MVQITTYSMKCPHCRAVVAEAKSVPGYVYRGLADQFPCRKCGATVTLTPEEQSVRDLANKVSADVLTKTAMFGVALSLVALVIVWLMGFHGGSLLVAFLVGAFVAFFIANKTARAATDFDLMNARARSLGRG